MIMGQRERAGGSPSPRWRTSGVQPRRAAVPLPIPGKLRVNELGEVGNVSRAGTLAHLAGNDRVRRQLPPLPIGAERYGNRCGELYRDQNCLWRPHPLACGASPHFFRLIARQLACRRGAICLCRGFFFFLCDAACGRGRVAAIRCRAGNDDRLRLVDRRATGEVANSWPCGSGRRTGSPAAARPLRAAALRFSANAGCRHCLGHLFTAGQGRWRCHRGYSRQFSACGGFRSVHGCGHVPMGIFGCGWNLVRSRFRSTGIRGWLRGVVHSPARPDIHDGRLCPAERAGHCRGWRCCLSGRTAHAAPRALLDCNSWRNRIGHC